MAGSPNFPKLRGADPQAARTQDNVAGQLAPIARAVAQTPLLNGVLPPWVALSLRGGFTNTTNVNDAAFGYMPDALRRVSLRGALQNVAGAAAVTAFATLPQGQRPSKEVYLPCVGTGATYQCLYINVDGIVYTLVAVPAGGTVNIHASFIADG